MSDTNKRTGFEYHLYDYVLPYILLKKERFTIVDVEERILDYRERPREYIVAYLDALIDKGILWSPGTSEEGHKTYELNVHDDVQIRHKQREYNSKIRHMIEDKIKAGILDIRKDGYHDFYANYWPPIKECCCCCKKCDCCC